MAPRDGLNQGNGKPHPGMRLVADGCGGAGSVQRRFVRAALGDDILSC